MKSKSRTTKGIVFSIVFLSFNGVIIIGLWNNLDKISWAYKGTLDFLAAFLAFPELRKTLKDLNPYKKN